MKPILKTIIWVTTFSIAMGYMETAVVVYLRALYYPSGFNFPLKVIDHGIAITEFWREMATLIMLYGVGRLAGNNRSQRFAFFIYSFAIWDICYYIFLKLILNWPSSFFTWDILFLIPVPWVGPVLVPVILSSSMIILALIILHFSSKGIATTISRRESLIITIGCMATICSCIEDYVQNLSDHHELEAIFNMLNPKGQTQLFADFASYIPKSFNWELFSTGETLILAAILLYFIRNKRTLVQKAGN